MELHSFHADSVCGSQILKPVVDHQGVRCGQAVAVKQSDEDLPIGLGDPFEPRNNGAVEPTEKRKPFESKRVRLSLHVGEGVAR